VAFKELIDAYNRGLPEGAAPVELRALPADSDLQLQNYSAALGSGRAPFDLLRVDGIWLADFDAKGWLQPLDALLPAGTAKSFSPRALAAARLQQRLVALPWNVDLGLLYSRKDLLLGVGAKAPPRTLAEMKDLARTAQAKARAQGRPLAGVVWQAKAYEGLTCNFMEAYAALGGSPAAVERAQAWERGPALKALQHLRGLLQDGLSPANTATELAEEESRLLFQSGGAVFMRNWPYAAALLEAEGSPVKGKVWVSALPGASTLGGWHLAVRAGSPRAQAAADLAAYLTSQPVQAQLAQRLGWNPSRDDAYARLSSEGMPHLAALRRALKQAVSRPRVAGYAAFSERSYQAVNAVLLGSLSPDEGAERLSRP
jgi:multiple sugar transport system substrate-binding protein